LNIIEVRNLPQKFSRPFIKIFVERRIDGQPQIQDLGETQAQTYENTVYNRRFQFDVYDDNDKIVIQVADQKALSLTIETYILLRELRTYMDDVSIEVKELWFNFDQETGIQADLAPQIRINFNYMYSKYFMYEL